VKATVSEQFIVSVYSNTRLIINKPTFGRQAAQPRGSKRAKAAITQLEDESQQRTAALLLGNLGVLFEV